MTRTYLVTGAGSGIGKATKELLESQGNKVIGVDLKGAEITADVSTPEGRAQMIKDVEAAAPDGLDAILAVAGVGAVGPLTPKVNFFGAKATMEGLRHLLLKSDAPRVAFVASYSGLQPIDQELLDLMLSGDEDGASRRSEELMEAGTPHQLYSSSKRAIAEWMRAAAITEDWAGAGIPLNAVSPGAVITPMTAEMMATPEGRAAVLQGVPMPLNGPMEAVAVAELLAFLTSPQNTHITAQNIFIDGGADATVRGPKVYEGYKL